MDDDLPPIGYEYWQLSVSSPYSTGGFFWIWNKYRVTAHREVLISLYPAIPRQEASIEPVDQVVLRPHIPPDKALSIWKALGYF